MKIESRGERGQRADEAVISSYHNIADLQATSLSRTSRDHVVDHDAPILRQPQTFRQTVGDGLSTRLDLDAMHVSILAQALVDELHDARGDGKAQSLASTRFGEDKSVNPYHVAFGIHQRAAAIAWVDRSVGLNVDHGTAGIRLSRNRTHDTHRHRVLQSFRTAQRKH